MRARPVAGVVAATAGLLLAGCGGSTAEPAATDTAPGPASACGEAADCAVVDRVDVDGDGLADEVGFVVESDEQVVVRVGTADGRTMRRSLDTLWFPEGEFFGAAPIDGEPGAEIVVGTTMGAHTMFFTTLTVRGDDLVKLDAPGREDEWMIDGAYSFHAGVTRRVVGDEVLVTLRDAGRVAVQPRFAGRDRTFVWRDGAWQLRSSTPRRYRGERAVARIDGWHVEGLPRMPAL